MDNPFRELRARRENRERLERTQEEQRLRDLEARFRLRRDLAWRMDAMVMELLQMLLEAGYPQPGLILDRDLNREMPCWGIVRRDARVGLNPGSDLVRVSMVFDEGDRPEAFVAFRSGGRTIPTGFAEWGEVRCRLTRRDLARALQSLHPLDRRGI